MLRTETVERVFGENAVLYLRTLLVDARGWNLRNNLCHASVTAEACNQQVADRVIHVLLMLANVRAKKRE